MSQQRQYNHHQMVNVGGGNNAGSGGQFSDTAFTKIFVGGLAWETQRETMKRYFEQFGEIQEAVVITDKNTGRSKGYGFVTFKDAESAMRACQDPSPVIDGRRANCNLASLGAHGMGGRYRAGAGAVAPPTAYQPSSSTYNIHQSAHYAFPYSAYGYSGYSQENMYPMNYYNVYGGQGQQFSPYYAAAGAASSTPHGGAIYPNFYPFYAAQYAQNSQTQGFGYQYHPQMIPYPYVPQHFSAATTGILSLPASVASTTSTSSGTGVTATAVVSGTGSATSQITAAATAAGGNTAEQSSSASLT